MKLRRESGVALVQVLLISALLLLLVVHLSKAAKNSVEIATQIKKKSEFVVKAESTFATVEYALMTQPSNYTMELMDQLTVNFYGEPVEVDTNLVLEIQDSAGLLSTSFFGQEWFQYVNGEKNKIDVLMAWQGLSEGVSSSNSGRNARLPYVEEILLLNGWETAELNYITHIPTGFFNAATAPLYLLETVYSSEIANEIMQLRKRNENSRQNLKLIKGLMNNDVFPPSKYAQVTIKGLSEHSVTESYSRTRMYFTQTQRPLPVIEIGIGTL